MLVESLMNLIFPRRCPVCDDAVSPFGAFVCASCHSVFSPLYEPLCMKCGRKVEGEREELCAECLKHPPAFDRGFSLWEYGGAVRSSVERFKYRGRREYADFYAERVYAHFSRLLSPSRIDLLLPVPLHKKRQKVRGYNQAALITSRLSDKSGIPAAYDYLIRKKNTLPQNTLDPIGRKENLSEAFSLNTSSSFSGKSLKTVLLIDDIYTTGSTANACSALLKQAGVKRVFVLCLASVCSGG